MFDFFAEAETWVAISFLIFVFGMLYLRVPKLVTDYLDQRAAAIAKELEEAATLRDEAQELLANYQRQQREAETEADEIIEQARREADLMREEAETALADQIERRTKLAEQKIAQAEAQALKDVKDIAADAAIAAARKLIAEKLDDKKRAELIRTGIADLGKKLH